MAQIYTNYLTYQYGRLFFYAFFSKILDFLVRAFQVRYGCDV